MGPRQRLVPPHGLTRSDQHPPAVLAPTGCLHVSVGDDEKRRRRSLSPEFRARSSDCAASRLRTHSVDVELHLTETAALRCANQAQLHTGTGLGVMAKIQGPGPLDEYPRTNCCHFKRDRRRRPETRRYRYVYHVIGGLSRIASGA